MTNICYNCLFLSPCRLSIMQNPVSLGKANQTPRPAGMKTQCPFSTYIKQSPSKPEHISLNALQILSHLLIVKDSVLQYRNSYFKLLKQQVHYPQSGPGCKKQSQLQETSLISVELMPLLAVIIRSPVTLLDLTHV